MKLKGVGRIRGRLLFNAGFKSVGDLKSASINQLLEVPMIGPGLVKRIKEQVGGQLKGEELSKLKTGESWEQKAISEF